MSYEKRFPDWEQRVIAASESTNSASQAAAQLGIKYDTYKKYAEKYGCFNKNQAGKGIVKYNDKDTRRIPLEEIFAGKHPQYKTHTLKLRLYKEGYKEPKCESCGLGEIWNNQPISLHLDHKNGNSKDNSLDNLRILCPNCHSQTETYAGKNKGLNKAPIAQLVEVSDLGSEGCQFESD